MVIELKTVIELPMRDLQLSLRQELARLETRQGAEGEIGEVQRRIDLLDQVTSWGLPSAGENGLDMAVLKREVTMPNNGVGVMEEIRSHLAQDKSSSEIIALGFNPSTVNKVQRQLDLSPETEQPVQQEAPEQQATKYGSLRDELACTLDRIGELETKASSADEWMNKCHDLGSRLEDAITELQGWEEKFAADQKARNEAEDLAVQQGAEVDRLKEVNQELQQKLASLPEQLTKEVWKLVEPLHAELEKFRPREI